jgi:putative ABC transport system permease protein
MTSALRAAVASADGSIPLDEISTMDQILARSVGAPRFRTFLLAALSVLALLMASVGIYAVTSYTVVQRTREFGIYIAVGASKGDLLRRVLGRVAVVVGVGLSLGLAASIVLTRLIAGWLYGVTALDISTFALVSLMLFAVACLASYIPARRATRIDPVVALRYE